MKGLLAPEHMPSDELLWRLVDALRRRRLDNWDKDFAASVLRQCRRRGRNPTDKQRRVMCRIVRDLRAPAETIMEEDLIEQA